MTRPTGQPTGVHDPERTALRERTLLAVIADRPGLRACEIVTLVTEPRQATATRLNRLMDRGEVERVGHKWFIAGTAPDTDGPDLSLDDERLLSAMRVIPGGSSAEVAALIGCNRSAVIGRARKLARLGLTVKVDGHWRAAEQRERRLDDDEDVSEFETIERMRPPFKPRVWVQNVNFYLALNPSPFACRRFG